MNENILNGRHIILGVSGSIAAYKACALASLLVKAGAEVHPVLTRGGARFITAETLAALCGRPALMDEFDQVDPYEMTHISLAERADAVVIAPGSANLIARLAAGMANDMLTLLVTVTRAPVLIAPAMNSSMWTHPLVAANVDTLQRIGWLLVEPEAGRLACGTVGPGKLAEPEAIAEALKSMIARSVQEKSESRPLFGRRILVTAGPTREPVDAVRFLGNRSSGKMGYAVAEEALQRGASVCLVTGPTALQAPAGAEVVRVETAAEMCAAVLSRLECSDIVIAAAAVADFTVEHPVTVEKIKRGDGETLLRLIPTVDIAAEVGKRKGALVHVGFAAEAGDPVPSARRKMKLKNQDLVVANDISAAGAGFDVDTNIVTFVYPDGRTEPQLMMSKREVAGKLLDRVQERLHSPSQ